MSKFGQKNERDKINQDKGAYRALTRKNTLVIANISTTAT